MAILCPMAADIVPIRLGLTKGDLYTLWAPRWRDEGRRVGGVPRQGRGSLCLRVGRRPGRIRQDQHRQRPDRPSRVAGAHRSQRAPARPGRGPAVRRRRRPGAGRREAQRGDGDRAAPRAGHRASIGSVCDLPAITKFFNGNPVLGTLGGGVDAFDGRAGRKRWAEIEAIIGRSWDGVVDAIDGVITTPDVDAAASEKAEAELAEPAPEPEVEEEVVADEVEETDDARHRRPRRSRRTRRPRRGRGAGQRRRLLAQGRHRPGPDDDPRRHLLHAALLPRRPAGLPGPQRTNQRVRLRACARPLPGRRARPRPVRPGHLRRHPHRSQRRLAARSTSPTRTSTC